MLRLKELRQQRGLTQKEVAKVVNYSQNLISTWENGSHEPSISALITLANFFNVSVDYLVKNDSNVPKEINDSTYIKVNKHLSPNQQACIKDLIDLDEPLCVQAKTYIRALKEAYSILKNNSEQVG
ncbi:MAG: helix-turn-helix transcriptional regulator [Clostridia bacterium]|nr:helix-turn-helix transcriptional regulator [Clostridia bacterium]